MQVHVAYRLVMPLCHESTTMANKAAVASVKVTDGIIAQVSLQICPFHTWYRLVHQVKVVRYDSLYYDIKTIPIYIAFSANPRCARCSASALGDGKGASANLSCASSSDRYARGFLRGSARPDLT